MVVYNIRRQHCNTNASANTPCAQFVTCEQLYFDIDFLNVVSADFSSYIYENGCGQTLFPLYKAVADPRLALDNQILSIILHLWLFVKNLKFEFRLLSIRSFPKMTENVD